jgi:hypothetical protein
MSQFYRRDGCGAEAEHPGVDYGMEETRLPEGWRTGPKGDFCPKHSMRIADGCNVLIPYEPGYKGSGWELAKVLGYASAGYALEILPDGEDDYKTIYRTAHEVHEGAAETANVRCPTQTRGGRNKVLASSSPGQ